MKVGFFDLSNLVSTKLIIINTADRVALCLRGTSLQVIMVRLIICDGFFMRTNGTKWRKNISRGNTSRTSRLHHVNKWISSPFCLLCSYALKARLFVLGLKQQKFPFKAPDTANYQSPLGPHLDLIGLSLLFCCCCYFINFGQLYLDMSFYCISRSSRKRTDDPSAKQRKAKMNSDRRKYP